MIFLPCIAGLLYMNTLKIIEKYYKKNSLSYNILLSHSRMVAKKALEIAKDADLKFIEEASMLHDIGIFLTDAPDIGCFGKKPYICHGYLGREILEKEGFLRHALVCERHMGAGITLKEIEEKNLPLPKRDMLPLSTEEKIICLADKFFSKKTGSFEKSVSQIEKEMYGKEALQRLRALFKTFNN